MDKTREITLSNRLGSKHERVLKEIKKIICSESLFYEEVKVIELKKPDEEYGPFYKVEGTPFVDNAVIEKISKILEEYGRTGFKVGFEFGEVEGYDNGIYDAWDCARKIQLDEFDDGFTVDDLYKIFGTENIITILKDNSAKAAVKMIKSYLEEKKFEVGDEVAWTFCPDKGHGVIISISGENVNVVFHDGSTHFLHGSKLEKTGKQYPQIAEIFKQLKGDTKHENDN